MLLPQFSTALPEITTPIADATERQCMVTPCSLREHGGQGSVMHCRCSSSQPGILGKCRGHWTGVSAGEAPAPSCSLLSKQSRLWLKQNKQTKNTNPPTHNKKHPNKWTEKWISSLLHTPSGVFQSYDSYECKPPYSLRLPKHLWRIFGKVLSAINVSTQ